MKEAFGGTEYQEASRTCADAGDREDDWSARADAGD